MLHCSHPRIELFHRIDAYPLPGYKFNEIRIPLWLIHHLPATQQQTKRDKIAMALFTS